MEKLISKLEEIIFLNAEKMRRPELEYDLSAMVFLATLFNYSKKNIYKEKCRVLLDNFVNSFENVTEGGLLKGFEGTIWVIHYLYKCNIIEDESLIDDLLEYNIRSIKTDNKKNNFDLFYGSIGKLLFILDTADEAEHKFEDLINEVVQSLNDSCVRIGDGIFWKEIENEDPDIYNIGLAHGTPSVLVFLSRLLELNYKNPLIRELIIGIVYGLMNAKNDGTNTCYFGEAYSEKVVMSKHSRLAWCYGDLGILYSLLYASKVVDLDFIKKDIELLIKAVLNRGISNSGIIHFDRYSFFDTGFCHGLAGITYLFYKISTLTQNEEINKRLEYWKNELVKNVTILLNVKGEIDQPWWRQNEDNSSTLDRECILNGFSGTGLAMLSLYYKKTNWSDIFLIY